MKEPENQDNLIPEEKIPQGFFKVERQQGPDAALILNFLDAQQFIDPGQELVDLKRLGQVVVYPVLVHSFYLGFRGQAG